MSWAPGKSVSLGYWDPALDHTTNGWTGRSFQIHREALAIGKKYSDANDALFAAQQSKQNPPDLGDIVTRHQRARSDYKRLGELGRKLQSIEAEVSQKQSQLRPFDYNGDLRDAALRAERRAFMRTNMDETARKNALRDPAWRKAALETDASLSGVSKTFHQAIHDEVLQTRFPAELQGISEGRAAIQAVTTAMDAVAKALEHEMSVTEVAEAGPPPAESAPWVKSA
jgi:hypothetical protein